MPLRLREPSLQALLRELAAFNKELCVTTTRTPVASAWPQPWPARQLSVGAKPEPEPALPCAI